MVCEIGADLTERSWLRNLIVEPGKRQQAERKRPLIYVYDLPSQFNSRMLQYRLDKVTVRILTSLTFAYARLPL